MGVRSPGRYCLIEGCRIAWEETGEQDAQPILCLHAAGSGSREFRPLLDRCPAGIRLILVDWPGHGRSGDLIGNNSEDAAQLTVESGATNLHSLMNQIGIERPVILGSEFGAAVALRYAADHPGQVLGLMLCLPAGLVPEQTKERLSKRTRRGVGLFIRRMQDSASGGSGKEAVIAAKRQALRIEALRPDMQSIRAAAQNSADRSSALLRKALDCLSCPAFLALSRDSREYPLRSYLALLDPSQAWVPQYQLTVFAGAFHPLWEEPDRFALALTSFVQSQLSLEKHTHAWLLIAVDWPVQDTNTWKCVHPDCPAERVLSAGLNANEAPRKPLR